MCLSSSSFSNWMSRIHITLNTHASTTDGIATITCDSSGITEQIHCLGTLWETSEMSCKSGKSMTMSKMCSNHLSTQI